MTLSEMEINHCTVGYMSVNASVLYKNEEICKQTNKLKFQLILGRRCRCHPIVSQFPY